MTTSTLIPFCTGRVIIGQIVVTLVDPIRPVVRGSINRCRPFAPVKATGYTESDEEPGRYERL